jgi:ribosome maturation factor RimP
MIFRIYIDSPKGVTVDDCSRVSRQVGAMMDVEDPFESRYALEVSSPGIDRPLFEIEHYRKYIGKRIKLKLYSPVNQRRQFKGVLQRVEGEDIFLLVDDTEQEVKLSYSMIEKASLVGEISI